MVGGSIMTKLIITITLAFFLIPSMASPHPGRTASDGCHYCRTNCDKWGVPWGVRHCHGRMEEPITIKKRNVVEEKKSKINEQKEPGWEYNNQVQKTVVEKPDPGHAQK